MLLNLNWESIVFGVFLLNKPLWIYTTIVIIVLASLITGFLFLHLHNSLNNSKNCSCRIAWTKKNITFQSIAGIYNDSLIFITGNNIMGIKINNGQTTSITIHIIENAINKGAIPTNGSIIKIIKTYDSSYALYFSEGTIYVIDLRDGSIIKAIHIGSSSVIADWAGGNYIYFVAVKPDYNSYLLLLNYKSKTVSYNVSLNKIGLAMNLEIDNNTAGGKMLFSNMYVANDRVYFLVKNLSLHKGFQLFLAEYKLKTLNSSTRPVKLIPINAQSPFSTGFLIGSSGRVYIYTFSSSTLSIYRFNGNTDTVATGCKYNFTKPVTGYPALGNIPQENNAFYIPIYNLNPINENSSEIIMLSIKC